MEGKHLIVLVVISIVLYLIFHTRECSKHGCKPRYIERFQQFLGKGGEGAKWHQIGMLYSQKAGDTAKMILEKEIDPLNPTLNKYRGIDQARTILVPINTNNRELRDGQLISIRGYENSSPFFVELGKTMKFQYGLASY